MTRRGREHDEKDRVLVLCAADHHRHVIRHVRGRRIEWVMRQITAVRHRAESIAVKQLKTRRRQLLLRRIYRREQALEGQRLQLIDLVRLQPSSAKTLGELCRGFVFRHPNPCPAHHDGAVEQPFGVGHRLVPANGRLKNWAGTGGSNPSPSSVESVANFTFGRHGGPGSGFQR